MILTFLSYVRSPFLICYGIFLVILWCVTSFINVFLRRGEEAMTRNTRRFSGIFLNGIGVTFRVEGERDFSKGKAVFVFNHVSLLDIPILQWLLPAR